MIGAVTDAGALRFEMATLVSYDDESLLAELRRVADLVPDTFLTRTAFDHCARVSSSTIIKRFGGWQNALNLAGLGGRYSGRPVSTKMREQRGRSATADDVIAELQRVAKVVGRSTVTRVDLAQHAEVVAERAVISRFGSWRAALEAAGLQLSNNARRWTDSDYFENILEVWTYHGRQPKYREMNQAHSRITNSGYAAKFGSWGRAVQAFVDRVNSDISVGVVETSASATTLPTAAKPRQEDQHAIAMGMRYQVLKRDRFRCVICGRSPATDLTCQLHVDHVLVFSRGGKTRLDKLRSLCADCNLGKGDRD